MSQDHVFQAEPLERAITAVVRAAGSSDAEASHVARSLVESNLRGHDSHGIGMVPRYIDAVLDGSLKPNGQLRVTLDIGGLLALDGQRAYGQIVGDAAMEQAIARARKTGS